MSKKLINPQMNIPPVVYVSPPGEDASTANTISVPAGSQDGASRTAPQPAAKPYMRFNPPPIEGRTEIAGLTFDFNYGARVKVPKGDYHVRLIDRDAALTLYDADAKGAVVSSTKTTSTTGRGCCVVVATTGGLTGIGWISLPPCSG